MLTSETVAKIKSYLEDGHRIGEIAAAYQISRQAVSKIASGRTHAGVRPARSVPALSKEADRIRQAKRAAQQQALRLHQRAVQQQQVSEFKRQADAAVRDEQGRRLDAERRAEELARQVEELTRQQAQTAPAAPDAPAAHEPEPAPDAERPHSLAGLGLSEILPLMDTGQLPADDLQGLISALPLEEIGGLLESARAALTAPDEPTRRRAGMVVNAALKAERAAEPKREIPRMMPGRP